MDSNRFDDLTKTLATATSRRQVLKTIAAATLGGLLGLGGGGLALADNSACAHWCNSVFAPGSARGQCTSDAAHHTGLCYTCGPASPGGGVAPSAICCARDSSGLCSSYSSAQCPCDTNQCLTCNSTNGTCVSSCNASQCQTCHNGTCASSCTAGQTCISGTCRTKCGDTTCPAGDTFCCGDTCCGANNTICCGDSCCPPGTHCCGSTCCPAGDTFCCGDTCCGAPSTHCCGDSCC